ncbi:trans-aconitate 2-methyltransferase [Streptomyces sp. 7-21]|jgi:SAM-dependent methyltransferase|uniref:class I SAM-dependent methyltransferase n=1 Tax=Streptomyces sp. 7-21 TaxID=2802283 RepID=UPI00191F2359|nr:class I SAM-dependent methyltransferase [Streptomyces sp. 7-21]MBL1065103.1 class I SAM-dependent methyltransferase [Streptomyces sp. 7-21]
MAAATDRTAYWRAWQERWDRQQEWYLPDREERFRVMLDAVEALTGTEPRVLDLACGTGSITARLLRRLPGAVSTGADLDPALLTIARGTFEGDDRVTFVSVDLTAPDWPAKLPYDRYDAVLTATALHWLPTEPLRALYRQLADLVRPGGVFVNADHMPDDSTPRISAAHRAFTEARQRRQKEAGAQDWADWWQEAAADPVLAGAVRERHAIYGDPAQGGHPRGEPHPPSWHVAALRDAGFAEARVAWASLTDAAVLALR